MRAGIHVVLICLIARSAVAEDRTRVPRVVSVTPANGAAGVDPSLATITVKFDMPMAPGGYSFVGGGEHFPQATDLARWVDAYTCALPVKLKANWDYQFGINSEKYRNFRSVWLVSAQPMICRFKTGGVGLIRRSPVDQRRSNLEAFDALCEAMRTRYSYLELRGVDWEGLFAEHRREVVSAKDVHEWVQRAAVMLGAANDLHLWLALDGKEFPTARRAIAPNRSPAGVLLAIPGLKVRGRHVATGMTDDGIGYVSIASWSAKAKVTAETEHVHEYLADMSLARGLVIDVRANSGGNETLAAEVAAWFMDEREVYAKHAFRRGPGADDFTPVRERVIEPNDAPRRYAGPVAVLMGPVNMSSCEAFLLMMKQGGKVRLFGERSHGSSGNPKPTYLSNGVVAYIPSWKAMTAEGEMFEGEGIEPDFAVPSEGVDFSRSDPVLAAALLWLRGT